MKKKNSKKNKLFDTVYILILISTILFVVFFRILIVVGESMEPTLYEGAIGIAMKNYNHKDTKLNRFDIVSVSLPGSKEIIKRIVGLPGETVEYKNGVLYIDDKKYEEPYLNGKLDTEDFIITLDNDEYFVLGDNRANSGDSRLFGPFKSEQIKTTKFWKIIN